MKVIHCVSVNPNYILHWLVVLSKPYLVAGRPNSMLILSSHMLPCKSILCILWIKLGYCSLLHWPTCHLQGSIPTGKQVRASLQPRLHFSIGKESVGTSWLVSGGLPKIWILLNGTPCQAIVETGAKLLVMSLDVVTWARLPVAPSERPSMIMGVEAEVQPTHVVCMLIQYLTISEENDFAMVEMVVQTVILRNDFGSKEGFLVDK